MVLNREFFAFGTFQWFGLSALRAIWTGDTCRNGGRCENWQSLTLSFKVALVHHD